jgi:hypothetical protein
MRAGPLLRHRSHCRLLVVVALAGLLAATVPTVTPDSAAATPPAAGVASPPRLTGLEVVGADGEESSSASQAVTALCPAGKQVVGGGGWTWAGVAVLTRLAPTRNGPTGRHGYRVAAAQVGPTPRDWSVSAYAFCADPVPGYELVIRSTGYSTGNVQTVDPPCTTGKRVLGAGAEIHWRSGQPRVGVGLQIASADDLGVRVHTQARRTVTGTAPTDWRLTGYAICANPPLGYTVLSNTSSADDSEETKWADVDCPLGRLMWHLPYERWRLLSIGGAVSNAAPGNAGLTQVTPDGYMAGAMAAESPPTSVDWGFIRVSSICVY